jgi:hypothetical protein
LAKAMTLFIRVEMFQYGVIFFIAQIICYLVFLAVGPFFPNFSLLLSENIDVPISAISSVVSYVYFIRANSRILSREEYLNLVILCSISVVLMHILLTFLTVVLGTSPSLSPASWVVAFAFAFPIPFIVILMGFSKWMGKSLLRAEMRRRVAEKRNSN